ncbi:MAG TPA: efflux RND transporter periplasmic adaptor subunit [Vicinamibacterales bacterium]
MWRQPRLWVFALPVVLAVGGAWALRGKPQVKVTTATVTSGPISRPIVATGTLEAVTTVQVGSQISGLVQSLPADYNSLVKKGEVIARIDPATYEAQLTEAQANLAQARADEARLEAVLEDARTKLSRAEALAEQQLITQSDLDAARIAVDQAGPDVEGAKSKIKQATAAVDQATLDLEHTVIRSPIDGVVVERDVDRGQTVAATIQSPVLFKIAADLTKMQVEVQVDESDVSAVAQGDSATFTVGSYPSEVFHGVVSQVRLQPVLQNPSGGSTSSSSTPATGGTSTTATTAAASGVAPAAPAGSVVSYTAVVAVRNVDDRLRPGMTAEVTFGGFKRSDAIRIPNSALSFRPPADILEAIGEPDVPPPPSPAAGSKTPGVTPHQVWRYQDGRFVPLAVQGGLADDRWTELVGGGLRAGDTLVTSAVLDKR